MLTRVMTGIVVSAALVLVACGGATQGAQPMQGAFAGAYDGAPPWVVNGCQSFSGNKNAICGVGTVSGTRQIGLARSAAGAQARVEIQKSLSTKISSLLKKYNATTTGGANFGTEANDEQHITEASKLLTTGTLHGTREVASWINGKGDTIWVLVQLDLDAFKEALSGMAGMKGLSEKDYKAVVNHANEAFGELDKAVADPANQ